VIVFIKCSVPQTERFTSVIPILLHGCTQEAFSQDEKHFDSPVIARLSGFDRTLC